MTPYYEDDHVTIYHGDSLDVLPTVASIDCVVTSPPYNTLTGSTIKGGGMMQQSQWSTKVASIGYADDMADADYWDWQRNIADALKGACRAGASLFYNHKLRYRNSSPIIPTHHIDWPGWTLRQEIVWARDGSMVLNARMFPPSDERIYWFTRDGAKHKWNQEHGNRYTSVWSIRQTVGDNGHPCPYPPDIPKRAIAAVTDPGDLILDPFMGSGTTLRAAKDLGRKAIGIEIEERYCEIAAKRMGQEVLAL